MAVSETSFNARLDDGKSWACEYKDDDREGLVQVWRSGKTIIVTWEECLTGRQYDESEYTRDYRYEFDSAADALAYVKQQGFNVSEFKP